MFPLWCAGKLGNCPQGLTRFRFTCLYCRWRRRYYGKFTTPPYWINYTYTSLFHEELVDYVVQNGLIFTATNGGQIKRTRFQTLKIDPRGHFTMIRCSIIVMLDKIMRRFPKTKYPLSEFCEFFSNYPTF